MFRSYQYGFGPTLDLGDGMDTHPTPCGRPRASGGSVPNPGRTLRWARGAALPLVLAVVAAGLVGTGPAGAVTAPTHFVVTAPSAAGAGTPLTFTVTVEDAGGDVVTGYTGTVRFTSSDAAATLPTASTLTDGTGTFSATLDTAGTQTITATDATTSIIGSAEVEVTGAAAQFAVSAPATTTAGTPFSFTVTAEDANDIEVTSYAGTVDFTSSDPDAVLPAASTLTDGTGTFTATLNTTGTQTITATDATTSITGSAEVDVPEKPLTQLSGVDRIATAIAVSQSSFGQSAAGAVVLARDDAFADALTGGPLAAAHDAPLLLTGPTGLDRRVGAEMRRVLAPGGTVYLLGGTAALSQTVEATVTQLGFKPVRLAGADRFGTAVQIATAGLGTPQTVLLVTGEDFADALAATPAASKLGAAILLTQGTAMPFTTSAYLAAHASQVYALGGPAAGADPTATAIVGGDRFQTSALVAARWFTSATVVGFASGASFPDGLAGGADMARLGGPMLLLDPTQSSLPPLVASDLSSVQADVQSADAFGGPAALPPGLIAAAQAAL